MNSNQIMGKAIRDIRIKNGLTENYVAVQSKLPLWKYKAIEDGEYLITGNNVNKIADALNVPVNDILSCLDHLDAEEKISPEIKAMLDLFYTNKHLAERIKLSETEYER